MFFQVAFLDFQNLQEWGRRINDTYTKMNGISEVRPSIFGGRRQIIRPCTLAGHGVNKGLVGGYATAVIGNDGLAFTYFTYLSFILFLRINFDSTQFISTLFC